MTRRMQNVGAETKARIEAAVGKLFTNGDYPSASKVAQLLGRKTQSKKGDGLNMAENHWRVEIMGRLGIEKHAAGRS